MTFYGKKSGPWLWFERKKVNLFGHRFAVGLVLSKRAGLVVRFAVAERFSSIVGWMPKHKRCTAQPFQHDCWSYRWLPTEKSWDWPVSPEQIREAEGRRAEAVVREAQARWRASRDS